MREIHVLKCLILGHCQMADLLHPPAQATLGVIGQLLLRQVFSRSKGIVQFLFPEQMVGLSHEQNLVWKFKAIHAQQFLLVEFLYFFNGLSQCFDVHQVLIGQRVDLGGLFSCFLADLHLMCQMGLDIANGRGDLNHWF